jgi:hypothetical protein
MAFARHDLPPRRKVTAQDDIVFERAVSLYEEKAARVSSE